jgi:hypothetical protein
MSANYQKLSVTFVGLKARTRTERTIAARTIAMINSEQIQALRALYANVEKQAHALRGNPREYSVITGLCPVNVIEMQAQKIQALLGESDADKALIAEQRQAITKLEISCDRNYVEGMKTGWNYCDAGNSDGFNTCVEQREKDIRDARTTGITLDAGE